MKDIAPSRFAGVLRVASVLGLVGLALMVWSIFVPTPMPVLVALSLGQVVGIVSFVLFLGVVVADLGLRRKLRGKPRDRGDSTRDER